MSRVVVSPAPAFELVRLSTVAPEALVALMNDPRVRRHLPLARGDFGLEQAARFVAAKERLWAEHGYGPWGIVVDGALAGWGGLQPEGADIDLGLILHPAHWGLGRALYAHFAEYAFTVLAAPSVIVLLPESRTRVRGVLAAGFVPDGEVVVGGERFLRYRLHAPARQAATVRPPSA